MGLRFSRVVPPLGVAVLTAAMALIPALRDHRFYLTDDARHVRGGTVPPR